MLPNNWRYLRGDIYYADMEPHIGSRIMDGSSKAGLESTSTWVGWFFFFSVRVVTVATINVGE